MDLIRISCDWSDADNLTVIPDYDDTDCINSSLLILEVEIRPILYVKAIHQEHNIKDILKFWTEVATAINADRK